MFEHGSLTADQGDDGATAWLSREPFRLAVGGFGPRAFEVLRVRGREALSRPFEFTVTFLAMAPDFDPATALGQPARLTLGPLAETPREVLGVIAALESSDAADRRGRALRVRIVPRLAQLQHRRTSRIFEALSVPEIVSAVLDASGIAHRFELREAYAARAYCVQYQETDLGFVRRLCAEAGIWFRFDAPDKCDEKRAEEIVTFGDSEGAPDLEGGAMLSLVGSEGALQGHEAQVKTFDTRRALATSALLVRGYDFRRPEAPLQAFAKLEDRTAPGTFTAYEHHDPDEDAHDAESGLGAAFLEQMTRRAREARGVSLCPRLRAGRRFVLEADGDPEKEGAHVICEVRHEGRAARLAGDAASYENRFVCVPASVVPRPARSRRKVRAVTETGVVVGPEGSEIHTDEHGRVRVRFHWQDARGKGEHAACWARVTEGWAGASWGTQMIPRVGMEVLVAFLGGDASRPVVLGCLRNATHPPPFQLPRDKATSGVRTRSTPAGEAWSELSFNDTKGGELVFLRAARDLATVAQNDALGYVGHDQTTAIRHDRHATIGAVDSLEVGEKLAIEVAGSARQEMTDDTIAHTTSGGAGMALSGGSASLKTTGNISLDAGGDVTIAAGGNITIKAAGTIVLEAGGALAIVGATVNADAGGAVVITGATVDIN